MIKMFEFVGDFFFWSPTTVSLLVLVLCLFLNWEYQRNSCLPPGPYGLPWIGYLPWIDTKGISEQLAELCKQYKTDILSISVLGGHAVVLNTFELAKEVFQKRTDVVDRPCYHDMFKAVIPHYSGVIVTSGKEWREARKFSISNLRDFGMGRTGGEEMVQNEARILCDTIKEINGEPFDPNSYLDKAVSNVTCCLVFGQRFDYKDKEFSKAVQSVNRFMTGFKSQITTMVLSKPFFRQLLLKGHFQKLYEGMTDYHNFASKRIEEHKKNYIGQDGDLIYRFMREMEQGLDPEVFDDNMLESVISDFFLAGSETTYTTLRWCLLVMVAYPQVCKKVREELDQVIGDREPQMNDKKNTPYTEAVTNEVQRHFTLAPIGMGRTNLDHDIEINGYRVPKGSFVVANLNQIHHDKQNWKNPDVFDPENFLENGKVANTEKLVPFSIGRRACAGESLARTELYLFFVSLVKNFDIRPENENFKPDFDGIHVGVYKPKNYKIRMTATATNQ